jgi:VanZ family protein
VYRILLIVIALILYGSLYPWDFHSTQLAASPLWVLIHSWPDHIDRFLFRDIAVNVVIYIPVGVFGLLALRQKFPAPFAVFVTVLLALALSSSVEMTQLFDDARDCSAFDVVCNVSGTVLGVALGYVYQQWLKRFFARAETAKLLHPSGAVLLLYTWLGYQGFPLFPVLSRTRLDDKFRHLFAAVSISPLQTFSYFVEWLVVAQLLENVLGAERTRRLFPLLLVVLPAKLLVAGRIVTWSELAGAALACICWYFLSGYQKRTAVVGGLIVSLLIVRGLAPYHWSRIANPFSWVPFGGFLRAEWDFGMLTLLQKCFWYGSAVWLLRATGWRLARAAIVLAVLLGAIEVIQIHLPGRVAEITDPLLALILAMTLGLLDRSESVRSNLSPTKVRTCDVELP